jgi:rhodanese-related sulfurtransferase
MEHSLEFLKLVEDAKQSVTEITVTDALDHVNKGAELIDVREDTEWNNGHARDAVHIGKGVIERDIVSQFPDKNKELILYCGGGFRSILAAASLQKMGYNHVASMTGGWKSYQEAGGEVG